MPIVAYWHTRGEGACGNVAFYAPDDLLVRGARPTLALAILDTESGQIYAPASVPPLVCSSCHRKLRRRDLEKREVPHRGVLRLVYIERRAAERRDRQAAHDTDAIGSTSADARRAARRKQPGTVDPAPRPVRIGWIAHRLGMHRCTIREMCEQHEIPGAYKTTGPHSTRSEWRVPYHTACELVRRFRNGGKKAS